MSGKARAALVCAVTTVVLLNAQTKSAQTKPAQRAASLYEEVKVTARRVLLRRLLTCGNALYAYTGMDEGSPDQRTKIDVRVPRDTLGEYRGVLEGITPYGNGGDNLPLSDRLNGLQWTGRIDINSGPAVRKRARVNGAWGPWSEWTSEDGNAFRFNLRKQNGKWFVGADDEANTPIEEEIAKPQPSCRDLPIR